MQDRVFIQIDNNGSWQTVTSFDQSGSQKLIIEMNNQKRAHPNQRVRAVDQDGRLLDLLA